MYSKLSVLLLALTVFAGCETLSGIAGFTPRGNGGYDVRVGAVKPPPIHRGASGDDWANWALGTGLSFALGLIFKTPRPVGRMLGGA